MLDAVLTGLDADAVRAWSRTCVELIAQQQVGIDELNVFPVADADTGSNVLATIRAADTALAGAPVTTATEALRVLATAAAGAAAGNSGFLVSQFVRGLADASDTAYPTDTGTHPCTVMTGATLAAGLALGAELARSAVVTPVEGTFLTVADAAASAANAMVGTHGTPVGVTAFDAALADVLRAAIAAADRAVQQTPAQLAVLSDAGVVDAGGYVFLVLLDAMLRVVTGRPAELTPLAPTAQARQQPVGPTPGPSYELQFHLPATATAIERLKEALARMGNSVTVVATDESRLNWNVHVHLDDVGAGIEAALIAGRPSGISVVQFAQPLTGAHAIRSGDVHGHRRSPAADTDRTSAVLVVAPGAGLGYLYESAGATVVAGGALDLPSAADVEAAIKASGAVNIVLLPNAARLTGVAESAAAAARASGVRVAVVPTRSPVQGLAAVAVHGPDRRFDDDVIAMAEAAAACRHAEMSLATTRALSAVGICEPGDVLGLIDGEVVEVGRGLTAVAFTVLDRLLGVGAELMTVLVAAHAPPNIGSLIEAHVRGRSPFTQVAVYQGGRLDHLVMIGAE